jgi:PST family polysaccharide transporter
LVIGQIIFPIWFFQGLEDMKYITILNIISKLFFTILIFIFVTSQNDYTIAALLYSMGSLLIGIISLYIIKVKFNIQFRFVSKKQLLWHLKDSSSFFLSRVSVSVYSTSNTLILGLVGNNYIVGSYAVAEKLYMVLRRLYQPISSALYPFIAKHQNINLYKKIFFIAIFFNLFILLVLNYFSIDLIQLITGNSSEISIKTFKMFLLIAVIVVPSVLLGYPFLGALGYKSIANYSVIYGSLFHIIGLSIFYFTNNIDNNNIMILLLCTELFILFIRINGVIKNKLWQK